MGYAGGSTPYPNYTNIGDHTETVQVDFDPLQVTYNELLTFFWESHAPTEKSWSQQYLNAVFYHNEQQRRQALASKAALEERLGRKVHSEIVPLQNFTSAEDYHQKYLLKQEKELTRELRLIYPLEKDFVNSTAVARVNGYVGGHAEPAQVAREIDRLGLSAQGRDRLRRLVRP